MEFHQFSTGNCILSYYEKGELKGTVKLADDFIDLATPRVVFPGADGNSVICYSELDTTYAVFVVDFAKRSGPDFFIRDEMKPAVDRTDFIVRPCMWKEVDFVRNYIKTADAARLSKCLRGGMVDAENRKGVLTVIALATGPRYIDDPVPLYPKPQIPPED